MASIRIGISGWRYPPWRSVFYPAGLPQRRELEYASRQVNSIEINGAFYSLQRPEFYAEWSRQAPPGFVFAVKGPRFITHLKKLRDVDVPLANFFASGLFALSGKLGPILWQLPPNLGFDSGRLADFFALLPRTLGEAAALATKHDERLENRALTTLEPFGPEPAAVAAAAGRRLRHVLEVRHATFAGANLPAFLDVLRAHDVGLVVADTAGKWPFLTDVTSDLVYVRLHGDSELYVSGYDDAALDTWAGRVRGWHEQGLDVHVYFDNDVKVRAPFDAMGLLQRLGIDWPPPGEEFAQ